MNFIRIYAIVIKLYYMKAYKKKQTDPYAINKQLVNAYKWLRSNLYIKTAAELVPMWGISKSTISEYLGKRRKLGLLNATKFEVMVLRPHNLCLKDFDTTILNQQAKLARKSSPVDIAAITATKLLILESGQELILDKLTELLKEMGELRELVTK